MTIFLLVACEGNDNQDISSDHASETEISTDDDNTEESIENQGIQNLEPVLTLNNALDLFYTTFETETINIESIQFKRDENENYHYFIAGWDEKYNYQLEVDVGTAEIIEQEMRVPVETGNILDLEAGITPKEAMTAALDKFENEAVEAWKLTVDQTNRMIYEIIFLSGNNQKVDALTGKTL